MLVRFYCKTWIGWDFQTQDSNFEVTWNFLTTTVASCNIPTAYLALSCQSEFILTEVTWNIFIKLMLVRLFQLSFETPLLKDVMLSYS